MAFTPGELLRGGFSAWVLFLLLLVIGLGIWCMIGGALGGTSSLTWFPMLAFFSLLIGAPVSLIIMLLGVGVAGPIARLLRRTAVLPLHAAVFSALGVAVGFAFAALVRGTQLWAPLVFWDGLAVVPAVAVAMAVPLGWWRSVRRARLTDDGVNLHRRHRHPDPDAEYEDGQL